MQGVPGLEAVLARELSLRMVQGYLRRSLKLFRLVFELIEVRTGGELLGHNNLHAERQGPATWPARRQPCRELDERVDSVLRADPHAPQARGNNEQRRARRQGCSLAAYDSPPRAPHRRLLPPPAPSRLHAALDRPVPLLRRIADADRRHPLARVAPGGSRAPSDR